MTEYPRLTLNVIPDRTCEADGCDAPAALVWEDYSERVRKGHYALMCGGCVAPLVEVEYVLAAAIDRAVRLGVEQRQADSAEAYAHVSGLIGETLTVVEELTGDAYDLVFGSIHSAVRKAIRFAQSGDDEGRRERERSEAAFLGGIEARRCTGLTVVRD